MSEHIRYIVYRKSMQCFSDLGVAGEKVQDRFGYGDPQSMNA